MLIPIAAQNGTVSALIVSKHLTKKQILVKHIWQVDEVLRNSDGRNTHYLKGKTNTTGINYNVIRLLFYKNGTGSYTTDLGQTFPARWKFISSDEMNIDFTVNYYSAVVTYHWRFVEISNNLLCNTTAISDGNTDLLVVARYVPVH